MQVKLLSVILFVTGTIAISDNEVQQISTSLISLTKDAINSALNDAQRIFDSLGGAFTDVDSYNDEELMDLFNSVSCNQLCHVGWMISNESVSKKCDDHCEESCDWRFQTSLYDSQEGRKRNLIEFCVILGGGEEVKSGEERHDRILGSKSGNGCQVVGGGDSDSGGGLLGGILGGGSSGGLLGGVLGGNSGGGLLGSVLGGNSGGGLVGSVLGGNSGGGLLGGVLGGNSGGGGKEGGEGGGGEGSGGGGGLVGGLLGKKRQDNKQN